MHQSKFIWNRIIDALLKEKYETQKRLDEKANHDIRQYFRNSHRNVEEMAKKFGFEINYGDMKGGFLTPIREETRSSTE